ncbi:MAG: hypothetical protein AAGA40_09560 [Cyanobacteria bacterium P01_E01_bin.45]
MDLVKRETQMFFREAPQAIREAKIEFLIIDQISTSMGTVADRLTLPFATVCNALLIHREPAVPPSFTHWTYSGSPLARLRNRLGNALSNALTHDYWQVIVEQRRRWNLPSYQSRNDSYSPLAQLCQLPQEFDFPRERLPKHFHYIRRF